MKDTIFGSAAPKTRSINVGANLLSEWVCEQARLRREIGRALGLLAASVAVPAAVLPPLMRSASRTMATAAELRHGVADLDTALAVSEKARKAAQPSLLVDAMRLRTQASLDRLDGEILGVLRAGNARSALNDVRVEVQGGEAHFMVQALAEDEGATQAFVRAADDPSAKVAAITTSRPSELLGPHGLSFVYEKRVGVQSR